MSRIVKRLYRSNRGLLALTALLALTPLPALAQLTASVAASGQYESNSNVFDLQPGFTYTGLGPNPRRGDTDYTYSGAADLKYQWSQQTVFGDATASQTSYDYYHQLDHETYSVDLGWNGMLGNAVNGSFEVLRVHTMVPFLDVFQPTLTLSTEQRERGGLGLQFLPRWRVEANGYTHTVTWPLPGDPNLAVDESEGDLALKYLGTAGFTAGLDGGVLNGHFTGSTNPALNPAYKQWTGDFVVNDMPGGRSTLVGAIGYTDRTSEGVRIALNSISGVTGNFTYSNQLTGKTSVSFILNRAINVYITNFGSEIDNSATLRATWQATDKIGVTVGYVWDYAELPGQGDNPIGSTRLDHVQTPTASITYQALSWLTIKPYTSYQTRSSNYMGGNFDSWIVGANLAVTWKNM
ncbi:MAG: hypothetical protein ACREU2_04065 [Steroidobacteraceae bacterium]